MTTDTRPRTIEGYIVGLENPNWSGLAQVTIAELPDARKTGEPGELTRAYIEAGFGVRQIVNFFGDWFGLVKNGPTTRLTFRIDDMGLIVTFSQDDD